MKKSYLILSAGLAFSLASCDTSRQQQDATQVTAEDVTNSEMAEKDVMEKDGLKMYPVTDSPNFPEAGMRVTQPAAGGYVEPGPVAFNYDITNFKLTDQTNVPHEHMANSHQGQHIHNIVDNEPYTAHYETKFTKEMTEGHHVVLSFLSRSYHESLKHRTAYDLRTVTVGKPAGTDTFDVNAPHMFYSRPKGEYKGDETKKVMLDFYLVNTDLSETGNKVRATVNGTEFMITKWQPYLIEGLPMGENKFKLELLDANGNTVPSKFNPVERTITLTAAAAQ